MVAALEVFSDLSERLHYNLPDFPLYVRKGTLRQFAHYAAACHWHPDVEFVCVLDGTLEYFVNGHSVHLEPGSGIFVNSTRLHYGFSPTMTDCTYIVVAVHPSLLGANTHFGKAFLEEKFGPHTDDFLILTPQTLWQNNALLLLNELYTAMYAPAPNPLWLLAHATTLCASISEHIHAGAPQHTDAHAWLTAWKMAAFIHHQYAQKLSLVDIATAGAVCRSRCSALFRMYLGQTPITYLIHYRIQKSCTMLRETQRSMTEIADACGFQSGSYFAAVFRKQMGMIPQEYRKRTTQRPKSTAGGEHG